MSASLSLLLLLLCAFMLYVLSRAECSFYIYIRLALYHCPFGRFYILNYGGMAQRPIVKVGGNPDYANSRTAAAMLFSSRNTRARRSLLLYARGGGT